ncbi:hypothetical protein L2E82_30503 [Cichorium intybus]|uniref:Uncharacterized protein n=1 Tax=Cichorium intybus TaxID=13427 RepID=A0ACB9D0J6_CICIN|nr:hypothetical protein L2E82_30503 [Cichorium intybus]
MECEDPDFLQKLHEALRNLPEGANRRQPRRDLQGVDEFKVTKLPEFGGGTDPERYLDWERKIERMFEFKEVEYDKRCKYGILKLSAGASLWFEGLKAKRTHEGKDKITS